LNKQPIAANAPVQAGKSAADVLKQSAGRKRINCSIHQICRMPPFDKIDASMHTHHRSWKRNFTEEQWQLCVQQPELIIKTPPTIGRLGGFIWKFQKNFDGKTLQSC